MSDISQDTAKPLRIVHVLRAPLGGLFRHVVDLTRAQLERGHAVGLITDELTGGERAKETLQSLAPKLELGILRLPILRRAGPNDVRAVLKVHRYLKSLDVDVVHGHGSKGGLLARMSGFIQQGSKPVRCYTPHGGSFNQDANPIAHAVYMSVEAMLAARTDVLLFESMYIAQRFYRNVGEPRSLVRIVQNGISPSELVGVTPREDAADFLYVGELRAAKGIDTLLEALAALSRRRKQAYRLVLVGSGPDREKLGEMCQALGIADQVQFPGAMPAREAFMLGRTLVVPSRAESLPYIVLEAAGAQIPMIATDVGGISEVFGPARDRLIACNDPQILAQAMERMLDKEPRDVRREAEDLAAFVGARFTIANMADSVIASYRDALALHSSPANPTTTVGQSFAIPH